MELRHLRYFVALAERLSFTRAAQKVHVTQSTLSHQINQLEEELGQQLFERNHKRVVMTEAGSLFLAHVTNALKEIDLGIWTLKQTAGQLSGDLRIGATQSLCFNFIPACVSTFLERHQAVKFIIEEYSSLEIEKRLATGDLDIAISYRPSASEDLWFEPLYDEEMVLVVSDSHYLARKKRVRMIELQGQPIAMLTEAFATRQLLDECFRSVGVEPLVIAETNAIAPLLGLARRSAIAAIVPENTVLDMGGLHAVRIESPTPVRTPGLAWRRNSQKSVAVKSFVAIVKRTIAESDLKRRSR
ncbi:LysR substrate-binding domain-containing protein [Paraburkholderia sp. RL18-085-BIA-A]|jgi:LysR family cyn operon transcriptional activator|uniref:LysR substrate-binding domain-containing protein n=1 Tax=Paraburkholderia sp. RL18-085-BIA-A TaxID=3031633 RepID=UPI0038B8F6E8